MVWTQIITRICTDFFTSRYPPNINSIWLVVYPRVVFLDAIINVGDCRNPMPSPTYHANIDRDEAIQAPCVHTTHAMYQTLIFWDYTTCITLCSCCINRSIPILCSDKCFHPSSVGWIKHPWGAILAPCMTYSQPHTQLGHSLGWTMLRETDPNKNTCMISCRSGVWALWHDLRSHPGACVGSCTHEVQF